jgi:hypothetical protein
MCVLPQGRQMKSMSHGNVKMLITLCMFSSFFFPCWENNADSVTNVKQKTINEISVSCRLLSVEHWSASLSSSNKPICFLFLFCMSKCLIEYICKSTKSLVLYFLKFWTRQLGMASAGSCLWFFLFFLYKQNNDRILVCLQGIKQNLFYREKYQTMFCMKYKWIFICS